MLHNGFCCPLDQVKVLVRKERWHTGQVQTEVPQGQRDADPEGQLDPDQHTGLEGVAVVPDVELRDDAAQVLLELEPEEKQLISGPGFLPGPGPGVVV